MKKLKTIVEEIEIIHSYYKRSEFKEVRNVYDEHVNLIILEAPKSEQYNLCNYWEKLKR